MASKILYVLYNADATVMGKLRYGYRKITCPKDSDPVCAACDITHGGLSLSESTGWVMAKQKIEDIAGIKVVQWHRDEISAEVRRTGRSFSCLAGQLNCLQLKDYLKAHGIRYPAVLVGSSANQFELVMDSSELAGCKGDPEAFLKNLNGKGIVQDSSLKNESML